MAEEFGGKGTSAEVIRFPTAELLLKRVREELHLVGVFFENSEQPIQALEEERSNVDGKNADGPLMADAQKALIERSETIKALKTAERETQEASSELANALADPERIGELEFLSRGAVQSLRILERVHREAVKALFPSEENNG